MFPRFTSFSFFEYIYGKISHASTRSNETSKQSNLQYLGWILSRKILSSLSKLSKVLIVWGRLNVDVTLFCVCVCVCVCMHVLMHTSGHAHGIYCFIKKWKRTLCCLVGGWMRSSSASLLQRTVISSEVFIVDSLLTLCKNLCPFSDNTMSFPL